VRETLFNWLGQELSGWRVLDAFAGSGALGFEAASRGAMEVVLLERDAALARTLAASRERLDARAVQVHAVDAIGWMARAGHGRFDLVLLDPPFGAGLLAPALEAAAPLVSTVGWLYVESDAPLSSPPAGFAPWRSSRAGTVHFALLHRGS
jgi:16S rRNA (guanine(966)-N(2))-methyltransferase RsmD